MNYLSLKRITYDSISMKFLKNTEAETIISGLQGLMEKDMATHSSTPAWKIPWMEKPGRLQSMGL